MFIYSKREFFPIDIKKKDLKLAKALYAQYGGPYGELGAALRYFAQRTTMPDERGRMLLTDIATEELGHVEMICTMIYQLTKGATIKEMEEEGLGCSYTVHGTGLFPSCCNGGAFTTEGIGVTGDYIADLSEDMAAEEKARATYEHLINQTSDPDVINVLLYLRQREIIHYNRFRDLLRCYKKNMK